MMNTGKSTSTGETKNTVKSADDAIRMLTDDHKKVKALFKQIEKAKKDEDQDLKVELAQQVCNELTVHASIEEEIFYPAVRDAIEDDDLMNEALVEHASAKDLIAQLSEMDDQDPMFDAKLQVLSEYIDHHVKEEETEMFVKAKKAKLDFEELGEEMMTRKSELMGALGMSDEPAKPVKRAAKK